MSPFISAYKPCLNLGDAWSQSALDLALALAFAFAFVLGADFFAAALGFAFARGFALCFAGG